MFVLFLLLPSISDLQHLNKMQRTLTQKQVIWRTTAVVLATWHACHHGKRKQFKLGIGDTDDITIYRDTKYSRYWYRRGHDTDDTA